MVHVIVPIVIYYYTLYIILLWAPVANWSNCLPFTSEVAGSIPSSASHNVRLEPLCSCEKSNARMSITLPKIVGFLWGMVSLPQLEKVDSVC